MVVLQNEAIEEEDLVLLQEVAERCEFTEGRIRPFARFGRSSAKLYLLRRSAGGGWPLLVKIDDKPDIAEEFRRCNMVGDFLPDAEATHCLDSNHGGRDALYLRVHGRSHGDPDVLELKDVYERALEGGDESEEALEEVLGHLRVTFESELCLGMAHRRSESAVPQTYDHYFGRYVTRRGGRDRLTEMFECCNDAPEIFGERIRYPLSRLTELRQETALLEPVDAIHGDLHLSNVVISTDRPHLVDFAWSEVNDHLLKDAVMMESSLRFMEFPDHVHPRLIGDIDRTLNETLSVRTVVDAFRATPEHGLRWSCYAMARCVSEVREYVVRLADQLFPTCQDLEREYFRCLYLALAGQQRFDTFPLHRVAWNLFFLESRHV